MNKPALIYFEERLTEEQKIQHINQVFGGTTLLGSEPLSMNSLPSVAGAFSLEEDGYRILLNIRDKMLGLLQQEASYIDTTAARTARELADYCILSGLRTNTWKRCGLTMHSSLSNALKANSWFGAIKARSA